MSEHAARSALLRMHGREVAVAAHYTGLASDLSRLATADVLKAEEQFMLRRAELVQAYGLSPMEQRKPFAFSSGIAVIPVHGTLINRFGYSFGYVTGYNFIRQQVAAAGQDPDVLGIVFDHNSYGGEAAGCFECAADIARLAGDKPTLAVVDSNCYSASFAIACGADKIAVTPSGGVGSVGVVAMHVSMEKMLKEWGLEVTLIHAGAHKVDGNPFEALPDDVKAEIQKGVNSSYKSFVAHVAKGRNMDEKAVRDTEARIYRSDDALSIGFVDAVATPQAAVLAFLGELSGSNPQPRKKEDAMSDATKPGATNTATPEELAKASADAQKAERTRVSGILGSEEAKGRTKLANHIAFNTSMSVDEAKGMLAAAPVEKADDSNPFRDTMDRSGHPEVGADGSGGSGGQSRASAILAAANLAGVRDIERPKH